MGSSDKLLYVVGTILVALLVIVGFQNFMHIWDKHHGSHADAGYDLAEVMKKNAAPPASVSGTTSESQASASATPVAPAEGGGGIDAMVAAADVAKGQKMFKSKCTSCHTFEKGAPARLGPNLYGVVGRDIGSQEGFTGYSAAMKTKPGNWTVEALSEFIASPKKAIPGTGMFFPGVKKDAKRADLLAYIKTLTD